MSASRWILDVLANTIHVTDLKKMAPVKVTPSSVRLLDYSKTIIPTGGQATLRCTHRSKPYDVVVQIITAENSYAPLLCLADSTRMGILNYDFDAVNQLQAFSTASPPLLGELTLESIKRNYSHSFEGLGELGDPLSLTLDPTIRPIQAAPHRYAAPKLPTIKDALDKLINTGQLIRVNAPTPWTSNMVVRQRPATTTNAAKVRILPRPSTKQYSGPFTPSLLWKRIYIAFVMRRSFQLSTSKTPFKQSS